jgi:predicted nucleic acid-binding protein
VPELAARSPTLSPREIVHVATCIHERINEIVTPDRGFDQVAWVRRIDPMSFSDVPA